MTDDTTAVPSPGSNAAIDRGCVCPILDNAHGRGFPYPDRDGKMGTSFWYTVGCRLHQTTTADDA